MALEEAFVTAFREFRAHKFRSALSFFALAIGAASILYTFAQTHGMAQATGKAIALQGPGRMAVVKNDDYRSKGLSEGLTLRDVDEIRKAIPGLYMLYPVSNDWVTMYYGQARIQSVHLHGTTEEWPKRDWVFRLRGRFLNAEDVRAAARVCVVIEPGGWYKKPFWSIWWEYSDFEKLVDRHDLLGKYIRLNDHDFLVVGALKNPPRDLDPRWYSWQQPNVLVPITAYDRYLKHTQDSGSTQDGITEIQLDTGNENMVVQTKHLLETILKRRHHQEYDFRINDRREAIQNELNETGKFVLAGTVLGAVAIFAGGIGIMNVTLATLFSRVREIGIRRAVGASRADILAQFIVEAALLGLAGGLAGVCLGKVGVSYFGQHSERDIASITWYHLLGVVLISIAASSVFALYPAWKASAIDPVEALRSE